MEIGCHSALCRHINESSWTEALDTVAWPAPGPSACTLAPEPVPSTLSLGLPLTPQHVPSPLSLYPRHCRLACP